MKRQYPPRHAAHTMDELPNEFRSIAPRDLTSLIVACAQTESDDAGSAEHEIERIIQRFWRRAEG